MTDTAPTTLKFWAQRGNKRVGPYPTRDAALTAWRAKYAPKRPARGDISTGYGEFGPHASIQFHPLKP